MKAPLRGLKEGFPITNRPGFSCTGKVESNDHETLYAVRTGTQKDKVKTKSYNLDAYGSSTDGKLSFPNCKR